MKNIINTPSLHFYILLSLVILISLSKCSTAIGTITSIQSIKDGETVRSSGGNFELGFFSPGNSNNRYLGIWYTKIPDFTVVWVANRNNPIADKSGVLKIGEQSNLVILNRAATVIWSSSNKSNIGSPVIAQLLDSGNLVVREVSDDDPKDFVWQSFDHPTDTLLPGMKLGWNLKTGLDRFLTSWRSSDDPSEGDYTFKIDLHGFPQAFITNRLKRQYRSGPWNGFQFSGVPEMRPNNIFDFNFTLNEEEVYYTFVQRNASVVSRLVMTQEGMIRRFTWQFNISKKWNPYWYAPKDQCDGYMECGNYGICDVNDSPSPVCTCVRGYVPRFQQSWNLRDGSGGCVQKTKFECQKDDGFLKMKNMKVPDGSNGSFVNRKMNLTDCEEMCRKNCSCTAYSNSDMLNGGSGCFIWVNGLIDLRHYAEGGQDVYVRVAASLLEHGGSGSPDTNSVSDSGKKRRVILIVTVTVVPVILLLGLSCCFIWKKKKITNSIRTREERVHKEKSQDLPPFDVILPLTREHSEEKKDDLELPLLDFGTLATATINFSETNKLGQGGFGSVYKGTLLDGKEIAVKRLSKNSGQGIDEFKNEVMLIARLQHRNLVRLLGCCIEGEEKMLIYEYMQNRSLDCHLFDKEKGLLLDWRKRFNIIGGIARGLLYLHQDSRFRIIHRDLKASNVLLDDNMNPKISDFGMARIFGGDQTEANTLRVVGTYGYMSPEYAMDGLFSIKSDVFSFGVLVLEIISGKKNRGFHYSNHQHNLLGYAWRLWKEERGLELMDETMVDKCSTYEVLRCMQVGLLCVQERAEDRPTMSSVVLMLSSETAVLPQPKQPGFCLLVNSAAVTQSSSTKRESCTVNQVTVTMLEAR